ncbi:hypothetical protein E2C01_041772 [Portunus trituberculatus]|uniref:Uncharacterized protein n=2 Tax=Portunus trituberculatus TaxID=210409 RepID=A0A5B7FRW3_PORTR|nr:hypothetical protein [Portunus trituberculatus]
MFESCSLMLASILLTVTCLLPDVVDQVILASRDVRVTQESHKKLQAVIPKSYVGISNDAFVYDEGRSAWEVTRVSNTPNSHRTHTALATAPNDSTAAHSPAMQQLTIENLQKLDNKTMTFGETVNLDTIMEESSIWSQESVVI